MIRYLSILAFLIYFALNLSSCRPPELEGAVVHYNAGRTDQAYDLAIDATQKYPNNAEAWYYLGEIQGKKGEISEMIQSFDKSLAIGNAHESNISAAKNSYYSKFYNDGVSAYNTFLKIEDKKGEDAKNRLNMILKNFNNVLLIRNDYMAHKLMALANQNLDNDEEALKYFISASDAQPDTVTAWIDLGYYFTRKKEFDKASEYFLKGLEASPNNKECLTMYAQSLDFADRKDEAIIAYKSAIAKNPEERAIPFNLGLLLNKQANSIDDDEAQKKVMLEEALIYFKKTNELDPDLKEVYDLLSAVYFQLEKYEEAELLLDGAVERFPDSASIWQNYSFLHAKLGNREKAEAAYEKAKQLAGEE